MKLSLFELLYGLSEALDHVESEWHPLPKVHAKKTTYFAVRMGECAGLKKEKLYQLALAGLFHDSGITRSQGGLCREKEGTKEELKFRLLAGEENFMQLPIRNPKPHLVLFHRERGDGSGAFGRKAGEYPREAGWLHLAERVSRLGAGWDEKTLRKEEIERKLQELKGRVLDPGAVELFFRAEPRLEAGDLFIKEYLRKILPDDHREWTEEEVGRFSLLMARIVDERCGPSCVHSREITRRIQLLAEYYQYPEVIREKLCLAGALHDLGKLVIPLEVLNKPGTLSEQEVKEMRNHVLYTYYILNRISGLQEITMWASAHHEKLNGKGYPFHLSGEQLFYPARMVACVDIYQALREPRAYKAEKSHESAVQIMKEMAQAGEIDPMIVDDLEKLFRR